MMAAAVAASDVITVPSRPRSQASPSSAPCRSLAEMRTTIKLNDRQAADARRNFYIDRSNSAAVTTLARGPLRRADKSS